MWDQVVAAVVKTLEDDVELSAALGTGTVESAEAKVERKIPSVRWSVITDTEEETLNPIAIQIDYWALSRKKAAVIEKRIRRVLTSRTRKAFSDVPMWILFIDGRDVDDPQPGVVHRSLDFRCVPLRAN